MTINPTAINPDSTAADVLAAFLPIVEAAFAEPWKVWSFADDSPFAGMGDVSGPVREESAGWWKRKDQVWACVAASYLMVPLMKMAFANSNSQVKAAGQEIASAALRLRDYWCQTRQETDR